MRAKTMAQNGEKEEYRCKACGRKISKEECGAYGSLCWDVCMQDLSTIVDLLVKVDRIISGYE